MRGKARAIDHAGNAPRVVAAIGDRCGLSQAAAELTSPPRIGAQLTLMLDQRRLRLQHLGGHAGHTAGKTGGIEPIFDRAGTHAANLEKRKIALLARLFAHTQVACRPACAPDAHPDRIGAAGDNAVGNRLGQRAKDRARHKVAN